MALEEMFIIKKEIFPFRELRSDLERCEPRVLSLQESANQLLDEKGETRARLQELRLRLQSLRRLTGIYALKLGAALGMDPRDVGLAATTSSLASLSHDVSFVQSYSPNFLSLETYSKRSKVSSKKIFVVSFP